MYIMDIFEMNGYRKNPKKINSSLVDLLTGKDKIGLYLSNSNKILNREVMVSLGANYGNFKPGGSAFLRGFEIDKYLYEIDSDNKLIVIHEKMGRSILSELDKVDCDCVIRNSFKSVLKEFTDSGYKIIEKK